jgi:hypothetical protein
VCGRRPYEELAVRPVDAVERDMERRAGQRVVRDEDVRIEVMSTVTAIVGEGTVGGGTRLASQAVPGGSFTVP